MASKTAAQKKAEAEAADKKKKAAAAKKKKEEAEGGEDLIAVPQEGRNGNCAGCNKEVEVFAVITLDGNGYCSDACKKGPEPKKPKVHHTNQLQEGQPRPF